MTSHSPPEGRMLLSHNFDISPDRVLAMSREEFAAVFQARVGTQEGLQCRVLHHPHWMVEVRFPTDGISPSQVGEWCANALAEQRRSQQVSPEDFPDILILGGLKTTPPTSDDPDALQPGNWGVDVVETPSGEAFLQSINWATTIAQRSPDSVFKIEWQET